MNKKDGDLQSKQFLAPIPTESAKKNLLCKLGEDSNSYLIEILIMDKICTYICNLSYKASFFMEKKLFNIIICDIQFNVE